MGPSSRTRLCCHRAGARAFLSLSGLLLAFLALALTGVVRTLLPPADPPPACEAPLPLAVSLPAELPSAPGGPTASSAPTVAPSPAAALSPVSTPTAPAATMAPPTALRLLFRADDPPATHGLAVVYGGLMPLVIPVPCQIPTAARRSGVVPCVKLLPPGSQLCASGIAGEGRLSNASPASSFALQADRVTLRDLDSVARIDALQGYFRYDDPDRGLLLLCPTISYAERISSNALRFIALCTNHGADGWAVSGQATDGGNSALDSLSVTVDAPDGTQTDLVGSVPVGGLLIRNAPE